MESARAFFTEDVVPISKYRAQRLALLLTDDVKALLVEVWARRVLALADGKHLFHYGDRHARRPSVRLPPHVQELYERALENVADSFRHEEMGALLAKLERVLDSGEGPNAAKTVLREELRHLV